MAQYFHISKKDLGEKIILKPKIPESAILSKEGNIPRICVCPKIYNCIEGITSTRKPTVGEFIIDLGIYIKPLEITDKLLPHYKVDD